jgi:anti-sigma factor RsiW
MNCKNVEELLPHYVGRDLEAERASQINTHLQSCIECARSAREYVEANQLLQIFEPPRFSEATYAAIRSNVLREIERKANAPTLIGFMRPLPLQVTWAVSAAVMVVVCVFAYYFVADRMRVPTGTAGVPPAAATNSRKPRLNLIAQASGHSTTAGGTPAVPVKSGVSPAVATTSRHPRLNLIAQASRHSTVAGGTPAVPVRPVPVRAARYSPAGESNNDSTNTSASSDKTLRLEIQTSNPNIRIIWFSHPPNTEGSPHESSKGI